MIIVLFCVFLYFVLTKMSKAERLNQSNNCYPADSVIYFAYLVHILHRLRVFENRVLMRILDRREMRCRENGENCITRSFVICTLHQV
jgi:hypothetical protein